MNGDVKKFLTEHPTTMGWLNEIIDLLAKYPRGAHVRILARELSKSHPDVDAVEQAVTRAINNYCGDAMDFKRSPKYNLFERVEPATYRLRTYPQKPDLFDLLGIEFKDATMQRVWKWFTDVQRSDLSSEDALIRFVNQWNSGEGKEIYADQKKLDDELEKLDDELDLDGIIP
jgi:hypothetical protein